MAKLVKLTSKDEGNNNSNSFKCQSDEDIIIAPFSNVSLLNAHISSGILSSYSIDGTDVAGNMSGLNVASLYLTKDKSDRERKVICRNGDYDITGMLQELTDASNKSLIFNSTPTTLSTTTDIFTTPDALDFGLQMVSGIGSGLETNKVSIKFNSSAQITDNFTYTNKNDGVNVDPTTGNVTYANPSGLASVGLDQANADDVNKTVRTVSQTGAIPFAIGDSCVLVDNLNQRTAVVNIRTISTVGSSIDNAEDIAVVNANTVKTTNNFQTVPAIFTANIGNDITMDDGTTVFPAPTSNPIYGKLQGANVVYNHTNIGVQEVNAFSGFDLYESPVTKPVVYANGLDISGGINVIYDGDNAASIAAVGFDVGNNICIFSGDVGTGAVPLLICTITAAVDNGPDTVLTINNFTLMNTPTADDLTIYKNLVSIEGFRTNIGGGYDLQYIPSVDGTLNNFNGTKCALYIGNSVLFQAEINDIILDATVGTGTDTNVINFTPNSIVCVGKVGGLGPDVLLDNIDALLRVMTLYHTLADAQLQAAKLVFIDKVVSETATPLASIPNVDGPFVNTDDVVIDELNGSLLDQLLINGVPFDFDLNPTDKHSVFPIDFDIGNPLVKYQIVSQAFNQLTDSKNAPILCRVDNTKNLQLTLDVGTTDLTAVTVAPTRIWFGTDITTVFQFNLNVRGLTANLSNFDTIIRGTLNKGAQKSFALQDTRLAKSCGRVVVKLVTVGAGECGIITESSDFTNLNTSDNLVRIKIENTRTGGLAYRLYRGDRLVPLGTDIVPAIGDKICIQWGVSPSVNDLEYKSNIGPATNPNNITANDVFGSTGDINEQDRQKMLFSISRTGSNQWIYLGAPRPTNVNDQRNRVIPWTPRQTPFVEPLFYDNSGNYRVYIAPYQSTMKLIELTKDPTLVTVDGVTKEISGDVQIYNDDLHSITHPDLVDLPHRLTSFQNYWYWQFNDLYFQKSLGYKSPSLLVNGATGSFNAQLDFLTAYLPENIVIFLDNLPSDTYDLEKTKGQRRNIIGVSVSTQGKVGEISIEPNNLYKIALNNKQPINLRKFLVSFETFYGEQVKLQSARAVVNLLFEPPK
jgi:hypothetical protein